MNTRPDPETVPVQITDEEQKKRCKKCGKPKTLEEFHRQPMCRDGRKNTCIECDKKYNAARYLRKKKEIIARAKAWQALNPKKSRGYKTKWRLKNIPPIKTRFGPGSPAENNGHPENPEIRINIENTKSITT